ncbi:DUF3052 domain-containing protein [Bacillota bacterium LX-D]|nr:DUF3052 domain-containing protein [Bacillota bacterium LX-D]
MNSVLKKLGLTTQNPVLILNAPDEYKDVLSEITAEIHTTINGKYKFIQVFQIDLYKTKSIAKDLIEALETDGHLWLCYPKGTSKKYKSDINREKAWDIFAAYEFEPVTQISIDDNWSAIRYRHVDHIKTMKRKTAASEKGKERIKSKESCK